MDSRLVKKFEFKSGIYSITNKLSGSCYIGSARNLYKRLCTHIGHLRANKNPSIILQRAYNKYGIENFKIEVLEECDIENLIEREQYYIDNTKSNYNARRIAETNLGVKRSIEDRLKMSETRSTKIYQYDLQGNFIKEWKSVPDASKTLNYTYSMIQYNLKNKTRRCKEFIFKYEKFDKIEPYSFKYFSNGIKQLIYKKDKEGNTLNTYKGLKEASADLGVTRNTISVWVHNNSFKNKDFIIEYGEKYK